MIKIETLQDGKDVLIDSSTSMLSIGVWYLQASTTDKEFNFYQFKDNYQYSYTVSASDLEELGRRIYNAVCWHNEQTSVYDIYVQWKKEKILNKKEEQNNEIIQFKSLKGIIETFNKNTCTVYSFGARFLDVQTDSDGNLYFYDHKDIKRIVFNNMIEELGSYLNDEYKYNNNNNNVIYDNWFSKHFSSQEIAINTEKGLATSTVLDNSIKTKYTYPSLFINKNYKFIVLFTDRNNGTIVDGNKNSNYILGNYDDFGDSQDIDNWELLEPGIIIQLENK